MYGVCGSEVEHTVQSTKQQQQTRKFQPLNVKIAIPNREKYVKFI